MSFSQRMKAVTSTARVGAYATQCTTCILLMKTYCRQAGSQDFASGGVPILLAGALSFFLGKHFFLIGGKGSSI